MRINLICSFVICIVICSGLKLYSQEEAFIYATSSIYNTLVWSDEFETDGPIDTDKWFHQTQLPTRNSWYNGEIQHYTNRTENTFVEDGIMKLLAKRETFTDQGVTKSFTSARLNSKFAFTYGRIEIRAKLPFGNGTWPAIWMLAKNINERGAYWYNQGFGTTNWPDCGEVDIMEHWGSNQNYVSSAIHTRSSFGGTVNKGGQTISTVSSDFHVYALEWDEEKMVFSVDGNVHYTYNPATKNAQTWPFDADQYLLLNVAILPQISSEFTESAMEIDYVRIYQKSASPVQEISNSMNIKIYPNPVQDYIFIEAEKNIESAIVYSVEGRFISSDLPYSKEAKIDVGSYDNGIYVLVVKVDGKVKSSRFIKE